jgi:flagellar biosynthesis/type III secretory pathway chaperone
MAKPDAQLNYVPSAHSNAPAADLLAAMGRSQGIFQALANTAGDKLEALRRADTPVLNDCTRREHELLQQFHRAEQQRRAAVARLAQQLPRPAVPGAELSSLVEQVAEPLRSQLQAKLAGLRHVAEQLREKNRLAALVAQELQNHIQGIFVEVMQSRREVQGYGPEGRQSQGNSSRVIVDAMG